MNQKSFGNLLGDKSQSWVARLEDPGETFPTISTLLEVAHGYDVDLVVRFAPFSETVDWMSGTPHVLPGLSPESLAIANFKNDSRLEPMIGMKAMPKMTPNTPEEPTGVGILGAALLGQRQQLGILKENELSKLSRKDAPGSREAYNAGNPPTSGSEIAAIKNKVELVA